MKVYICTPKRKRSPFLSRTSRGGCGHFKDTIAGIKLLRAAFLLPLLFTSCAGNVPQRIIVPRDPVGARFQDWLDPLEQWKIVESQNGAGDADLPDWVRYFFTGRTWMIESMEMFDGRYVFIARNQGDNFNALRQWVGNFCPKQDLARLIVHRVERRFVAEASLYPDDEYGEYFMRVIREVSNGEFPGAVKEETFWVRRQMVLAGNEGLYDGDASTEIITDRFEYLVLVSMDTETLQGQLRQIMEAVRTTVPPTREQAAAIGNIRQTFFEGF